MSEAKVGYTLPISFDKDLANKDGTDVDHALRGDQQSRTNNRINLSQAEQTTELRIKGTQSSTLPCFSEPRWKNGEECGR